MKCPYSIIKFLWLVGCLFIFVSCEKNIDFDLNDTPPAMVVDARIENGGPPIVQLNRSLDFFGIISLQTLASSFVRDAEVYISNGSRTHRLKEYEVPVATGISLFYYSTDTSDPATAILGELNNTYNLRIVEGGKEYLSETTIPPLAAVPDSVWFEVAPANPDTLKRIMILRATDPPGLGNYIRYFTKVNNEPFYPGPNSIYSDQVFDGDTYQAILPRGYDKNNPPREEDNYFLKGDTVSLKFCNIDKATYDFWNTWEFSFQSIGNPFGQPGRVLGNVSNGALGAFCGYAAWYRTFVLR